MLEHSTQVHARLQDRRSWEEVRERSDYHGDWSTRMLELLIILIMLFVHICICLYVCDGH